MLKRLILLVPLLLIFIACTGALAAEETQQTEGGFAFEGVSTPSVSRSAFQLQDVQTISNPEAVSYLHAEVRREGSVYLFDNSPFQSARELVVTLTVPQNTSIQRSFIKRVEGPDRYFMDKDEWGNVVIKLYWEIPELKKRLSYALVSDVEVFSGQEGANGRQFPSTPLTKETPEIAKTAYDASYGLDGLQRTFALTSWVYENMRYDNAAKEFAESAKWAFQNRKGACDEFSNLLISMLRVIGYNPRYVVGYAYSESWGQHGWVELDYQGKTLSLDPTWLESPVDSTHIKIAELPDANLSEHVEVRGGQITIDWDKGEPEVLLISHKEEPRIEIGTTLVPENSTGGSFSLLETDFRNPGCVLTKVRLKSCTMSFGPFLSLSKSDQTLAFCGLERGYWFLKSPQIERGMVYTCPVIIYGGGAERTVTVNVAPDSNKKLSTAVSSQDVFTPGQTFEVSTVTENSGHATEDAIIYLFFKGSVQSKDFSLKPGESASIKWTLKAPSSPGNHEFSVFSSSGELVSRNITVVSQRHAQIENISIPGKSSANAELSINVTVRGITGFSGTIKAAIDDYSDTKQVSLGPSESRTYTIYYTPGSAGQKTVSITLLSDSQQYEDGWWGSVQADNQRQWWDDILDWLQGIADTIVGAFTGG